MENMLLGSGKNKSKFYRHLKLVTTTLVIIAMVINIKASVITAAEEATSSLDITLSPDRLEKIKNLKERLATKVAELRKEEQKPNYLGGEVRKIGDLSLIVRQDKDNYEIKVNEETEIILQDDKQQEIDLDEITPGQLVLAIGQQEESIFKATHIIVRPKYQFLIGKISSIDYKGGQFILATSGGNITVDVERFTRTNLYDEEKEELVRSGFSKLKVGNKVHVLAKPTEEAELVTGLRILTLPLEEIFPTSPTPTVTKKEKSSEEPEPITSPTATVEPTE